MVVRGFETERIGFLTSVPVDDTFILIREQCEPENCIKTDDRGLFLDSRSLPTEHEPGVVQREPIIDRCRPFTTTKTRHHPCHKPSTTMSAPTDKAIPLGAEAETFSNGNGVVRRRLVAELQQTSETDANELMPIQKLVRGIDNLAQHVHPPVPNPAPLGLIAFGFTTCLLQMKHTRLTGSDPDDVAGVNALVLGFAMWFGGLLQIIAGLSEIRRNNIFGYTAFCVYGGFWMSLSTVNIVSLLATTAPPANTLASEAMLFLLGIVSFMLWVLTFQLNKTICSLFFLLTCTCFLLSFGTQNETVDIVGGYFGILTSANAFWLAFVELVNDIMGHGKEIIPLFHWHWNRRPRHIGGLHIPGRIRGHTIAQLNASASNNSRSQSSEVKEARVDEAV
jgi:hypothetical protein